MSPNQQTRTHNETWGTDDVLSPDIKVRHRALEELVNKQGNQASRTLMSCYHDCFWRATQLFIVGLLGRCTDSRTHHFLMRLVGQSQDLPLAQAAIWALAQHKTPESILQLAYLYAWGHTLLKPTIAAAFPLTGSPLLDPLFLRDLKQAMDQKDLMLLRPLVVTLSERRCFEAAPLFMRVCQGDFEVSCQLAAMGALAKVCRNREELTSLRTLFSHDPFLLQAFMHAESQWTIRSHWSLEDYLHKISQGNQKPFHPLLPLELKAFSSADVRDGLQLIAQQAGELSLVACASTWGHPAALTLLADLADSPQTSGHTLQRIGDSIFQFAFLEQIQDKVEFHLPQEAQKILLQIRLKTQSQEIKKNVNDLAWSMIHDIQNSSHDNQPKSLALAHEESHFFNVFFLNMSIFSSDKQHLRWFEKWILSVLPLELKDLDPLAVSGLCRLLRGLAEVNGLLPRVNERLARLFKKQWHGQPPQEGDPIYQSFLVLAEWAPTRWVTERVVELFVRDDLNKKPLLGVLAHQILQQDEWAQCKGVVLNILNKPALRDSLCKELLGVLVRYPMHEAEEFVVHCLQSQGPFVVPALLAAKALKSKDLVEPVAALLQNPSATLRARALDSLLCFSLPRAVKLVLEHLDKWAHDAQVVDKIIRCIPVPQSQPEAFLPQVNDLLQRYGGHSLVPGLMEYRGRLQQKGLKKSLENLSLEQQDIDKKLSAVIGRYPEFDEQIKATLRAAELPFLHTSLFEGRTDKSMPVLQYCKALDLLIDQRFCKRIFMPELNAKTNLFHRILYDSQMNGEFYRPLEWLTFFKAEGVFSADSLPAHKMQLVGQGVLSGKIFSDQWRVLDGLRAWAAVFILFAGMPTGNVSQVPEQTLLLPGSHRKKILQLAAVLNELQDLRNPVAHRQTLLQFAALQDIRTIAMKAFQLVGETLC